MHLLQQTEPFPDKPGGDRLAGWLSVILLHDDDRGCHNASGGASGAAKEIAGKQATRRPGDQAVLLAAGGKQSLRAEGKDYIVKDINVMNFF